MAIHGVNTGSRMKMRPACDINVVNGAKVLTQKQLDKFNQDYGHLRGNFYVGALNNYTQRYGFRDSDFQIN